MTTIKLVSSLPLNLYVCQPLTVLTDVSGKKATMSLFSVSVYGCFSQWIEFSTSHQFSPKAVACPCWWPRSRTAQIVLIPGLVPTEDNIASVLGKILWLVTIPLRLSNTVYCSINFLNFKICFIFSALKLLNETNKIRLQLQAIQPTQAIIHETK